MENFGKDILNTAKNVVGAGVLASAALSGAAQAQTAPSIDNNGVTLEKIEVGSAQESASSISKVSNAMAEKYGSQLEALGLDRVQILRGNDSDGGKTATFAIHFINKKNQESVDRVTISVDVSLAGNAYALNPLVSGVVFKKIQDLESKK